MAIPNSRGSSVPQYILLSSICYRNKAISNSSSLFVTKVVTLPSITLAANTQPHFEHLIIESARALLSWNFAQRGQQTHTPLQFSFFNLCTSKRIEPRFARTVKGICQPSKSKPVNIHANCSFLVSIILSSISRVSPVSFSAFG